MKNERYQLHEIVLLISLTIFTMIFMTWGVLELVHEKFLMDEPTPEVTVTMEVEEPEPAPEIDIIEPVVTEIPEPEPEPEIVEPTVEYYDVSLSEDLQDHIFAVCEKYGVDPGIVIAVIEYESEFDPSEIGDSGNAYGLMQIWPKWHWDRMERLGVSKAELLDPYKNVEVGIDYLAELLDRDKGLEWALMAYNGGAKNANKRITKVVNYKNTVLANYDALEKVG